MMQVQNRINVRTATVRSNSTGEDVTFRMLRDGTMWMSENGDQRPEDFVQVDPDRRLPGIPQSTI